jgi:hypothetical protein
MLEGYRTMTTDKLAAGEYESAENILHLWFPRRVELVDEEAIRAFFDEVITEWIRPRSSKQRARGDPRREGEPQCSRSRSTASARSAPLR